MESISEDHRCNFAGAQISNVEEVFAEVRDYIRGMKNFFLMSLAGFFLAGCATLSEHSALVGHWRCLSATIDGKSVSEKKTSELRLTITKDRYKTEDAKEVLFDSVFSLDSTSKPARISMTGTEGDLTGKQAKGIFEVSGDLLVLCYTMPEKAAPVSFQSAPGSGAYLTIWKREK